MKNFVLNLVFFFVVINAGLLLASLALGASFAFSLVFSAATPLLFALAKSEADARSQARA